MFYDIEKLLALTYGLLIVGIVANSFLSRDRSAIFSPINFLCAYYAYYILYPYFSSKGDIYGVSLYDGNDLLLLAAIINLLGILFGYYFFRPIRCLKSNELYNSNNGHYLAVSMLIIGSLAYFSIYGFTLNIVAEQTDFYDATEHRLGHTEQYITMLISLLPAAFCLFYAMKDRKIYLIITILSATIIGVLGGSRYRLFMFFIPIVVFCHLYPTPKKIKYIVWIPIMIIFILTMGIIEKTRNYGSGLDIERLSELLSVGTISDVKASEAELVYTFSAKVMDAYQDEPIMPIDVFGTALCLPIPRALFPQKPNAQYLIDANIKTLGTDAYGAAYLNIVEWYLALGWFGVLLNGIILGMLSKFFWINYRKNPQSIGSVLNLSMFDGICYILVSRGYLAQEFVMFVYYLPMIYWVSLILLKLNSIIRIKLK